MKKIISKRLNIIPNFENTNQKLSLYENNTFKYGTSICSDCSIYKIIKRVQLQKTN